MGDAGAPGRVPRCWEVAASGCLLKILFYFHLICIKKKQEAETMVCVSYAGRGPGACGRT